jgi:aspartate/methionine/tyrosine aminotransferase
VQIADFKIERFFAQYEFAVPYLLGASDIEGYRQRDLLALADDEGRHLWDELTLGYTESTGHPRLRAEIASLYDRIAPDDVIVSSPIEAIFLFAHAALQPGDHIIVVWPAYQALYEAARSANVDVTLLRLSAEHGWRLDAEEVRKAMRPNTRAIVINSPHNPTGATIDRATFETIAGLARDAGAWLFSDEMYRFLEFDEAERLPAGADIYERGISLCGMSKSLALGGTRIGWLATRDRDLLARVARLKDYTSICSSAPSEILALIALRARDRVLVRSHAIIQKNLGRLDRFFDEWQAHLTWVRPRGGSIGFPSLRPHLSIDDFARDLLADGVCVVPGSVFDYPGRHFRLGFGRSNLPEALDRVASLLART